MAKLFILAFEALAVFSFSSVAPWLTHPDFPGHNFHHIEAALICDTHFPGEYLAFFTGIPVCLGVLEMGQSSYGNVAPYFSAKDAELLSWKPP